MASIGVYKYHVVKVRVYNSQERLIDFFIVRMPLGSERSVFSFVEERYIRVYGYVPKFHRVTIDVR